MDYCELDENLKLLNGFHNDLSKRNEIVEYIEKHGKISVFAYASLIWKPIEHFNELICDCILHNYKKGFFSEDFIYRGTTDLPGLTMGLKKDSDQTVNGVLLVSNGDQIIPFIKAFVERETPVHFNGTIMDIYTYEFVKIQMPDRIHFEYALTCVVNTESKYYLAEELSYEEQAKQIGRAYGMNGTNLQYLEKLKLIYSQLNINDSFTDEFEDLYDKILRYRQSLSIKEQKWFEIYDQLQTLEQQRKPAFKKQNSLPFQKEFSLPTYFQKQLSHEITFV